MTTRSAVRIRPGRATGTLLLFLVAGLPCLAGDGTNAPNGQTPAQVPPATVQTNAGTNYPVIGYLEKRDRTITIKAGPNGPLYTVKTADGRTVCADVSADKLRAQAPDIHEFLTGAMAGGSGQKKGPVVDASVRPLRVR